MIRTDLLAAYSFTFGVPPSTEELPDIRSVKPDLFVPPMTISNPAPGNRIRQVAPEYRDTEVYHVLYLPTDWQEGKRYPVIVEYAGNETYENKFGDKCTGKVEDCKLGYGISGGKRFIWVCLPYISKDHQRNQLQWWGDVDATVDYCKKTVMRICQEYGGDPSAVILAGFSRGAIACNYIGLYDDEIASLWLAFIAHSHYDGVRRWVDDRDDKASALKCLERLKGRAQFISHEGSTGETQDYLKSTGIDAPFTFMALPYRNHTDTWVLRDIPARRILRQWLKAVIQEQ